MDSTFQFPCPASHLPVPNTVVATSSVRPLGDPVFRAREMAKIGHSKLLYKDFRRNHIWYIYMYNKWNKSNLHDMFESWSWTKNKYQWRYHILIDKWIVHILYCEEYHIYHRQRSIWYVMNSIVTACLLMYGTDKAHNRPFRNCHPRWSCDNNWTCTKPSSSIELITSCGIDFDDWILFDIRHLFTLRCNDILYC